MKLIRSNPQGLWAKRRGHRTRYYKWWLIPFVWIVKKIAKQGFHETNVDPFEDENWKFSFHRIEQGLAICFRIKDET